MWQYGDLCVAVKEMLLMLIEERMWSYKVKSAIPHNFLKKFCCEGENYEVVAKGTY